jgi:hypothetical protein
MEKIELPTDCNTSLVSHPVLKSQPDAHRMYA